MASGEFLLPRSLKAVTVELCPSPLPATPLPPRKHKTAVKCLEELQILDYKEPRGDYRQV